jgi:hypothetical protein
MFLSFKWVVDEFPWSSILYCRVRDLDNDFLRITSKPIRFMRKVRSK